MPLLFIRLSQKAYLIFNFNPLFIIAILRVSLHSLSLFHNPLSIQIPHFFKPLHSTVLSKHQFFSHQQNRYYYFLFSRFFFSFHFIVVFCIVFVFSLRFFQWVFDFCLKFVYLPSFRSVAVRV